MIFSFGLLLMVASFIFGTRNAQSKFAHALLIIGALMTAGSLGAFAIAWAWNTLP